MREAHLRLRRPGVKYQWIALFSFFAAGSIETEGVERSLRWQMRQKTRGTVARPTWRGALVVALDFVVADI